MALEPSSPPLPGIFDDTGEDFDVMGSMTSTERMTTERWSNVTKKMKCSIGEDTTQRITVVSIIMICTIVGNLALILTLTCKRSRRIKRVNVFLINLAIGDLAVAVFTNTTEILFLAFGDWALGPFACKISVYMQIVTLASATFLLTAMSMDRYQVIVKPLQSLARRPRIWMKVTTAWVMAFVFATPQLFIFLQITEEHDGMRRRCCVSKGYTEEWQRKAYLSFNISYILLLPTALMIYCYANIIHVVWIRARAEDVSASGGKQHAEKEESTRSPRMSMRRGLVTASKRRALTMTLTVVAGFLFCQTPYFIVSAIRVFSDYRIRLPALLSLSEYIVLMHSTLNPVLYGLFTLRGYHVTAALRCLLCKDVPVSQAESDLLLRGKKKTTPSSGKPSASNANAHTNSISNSAGRVIYHEAPSVAMVARKKKEAENKDRPSITKNGPCKEGANHESSGCSSPTCPTTQNHEGSGCSSPTCPTTQNHEGSGCSSPTCPTTQNHEGSDCSSPTCPTTQNHEGSGCSSPTCPTTQNHEGSGCSSPTCPTTQNQTYGHEEGGTEARTKDGVKENGDRRTSDPSGPNGSSSSAQTVLSPNGSSTAVGLKKSLSSSGYSDTPAKTLSSDGSSDTTAKALSPECSPTAPAKTLSSNGSPAAPAKTLSSDGSSDTTAKPLSSDGSPAAPGTQESEQEQTPVPVRERVPYVSKQVILASDPSGNHTSSALLPSSPWIATQTDGKSECHGCV